MGFALSQAISPGGLRRSWKLPPALLLATAMAAIVPPAVASGAGDHRASVQQQSSAESRQSGEDQAKQAYEPGQSTPPTAQSVCEVLATAATANDLPVDFFTRLIWQESRFKPDAISPKGAQGIAQFMPMTARSSGLADPFNPLDAIAKSGQLLRELRHEFGNLGLAAAAYNAGSGRVHDWIGGRRSLPRRRGPMSGS
jgi:soluble lytic murein transglycosylase-like protein